jgi:hypothetical protein
MDKFVMNDTIARERLIGKLNQVREKLAWWDNLSVGPGINVNKGSTGPSLSLSTQVVEMANTIAAETASTTPVAELCEAYSGSVIYRAGEHVMLDDLVYNCLTAGTVGESPDSSENWEVVMDGETEVVGITSWPNTPLTAYCTRIRTNGRYNNTTHVLSTCYTVTTFNSLGAVIGMDAIVIETMTTAVPDVDE